MKQCLPEKNNLIKEKINKEKIKLSCDFEKKSDFQNSFQFFSSPNTKLGKTSLYHLCLIQFMRNFVHLNNAHQNKYPIIMCYENGHLKRMDIFKNSSYPDHLGCVNAYQRQLNIPTSLV